MLLSPLTTAIPTTLSRACRTIPTAGLSSSGPSSHTASIQATSSAAFTARTQNAIPPVISIATPLSRGPFAHYPAVVQAAVTKPAASSFSSNEYLSVFKTCAKMPTSDDVVGILNVLAGSTGLQQKWQMICSQNKESTLTAYMNHVAAQLGLLQQMVNELGPMDKEIWAYHINRIACRAPLDAWHLMITRLCASILHDRVSINLEDGRGEISVKLPEKVLREGDAALRNPYHKETWKNFVANVQGSLAATQLLAENFHERMCE